MTKKIKKKPDVTKRQKKLVDELIATAKAHGISEEYGTGSAVDSDTKSCAEACFALEKELRRLNRSVKTLNDKNKELGKENRALRDEQP